MKIFIAGCARSGTTLAQELMRCFDDVFVHSDEAAASKFDALIRPETGVYQAGRTDGGESEVSVAEVRGRSFP